MADLDWTKHDKEITEFVKRITNYYLRTDATTGELIAANKGILLRNNYATPRLMQKLLNYLSAVTEQVEDKVAATRQACLTAGMDLETCVAGSTTFVAIFGDYEDWEGRFAGYLHRTTIAMQRNPDASGDTDPEFWEYVTKPLLLGLFPGEKQQTVLDAVTPVTLAWQIEVAEEHYRENLAAFWEDLKQGVRDMVDSVTGWGVGLGLLAVLAIGLGYGYGRGRG
jgi:hypothetical protein